MKALVLGASGFLGGRVVQLLSNEGISVIPASKSLGLDLCDPAKTVEFFDLYQPDYIINCASFGGSVHFVMQHHADIININLKIILNLYEAIARVSKKTIIINAMANCSYPAHLDLQAEEFWQDGPVHSSVISFGNATRMKHIISQCYAQQHGIKSRNFLFGGIFGPFDHLEDHRLHALDGIILRMVRAKLSKEPSLKIWGTGKPVREWIYVKDAARVLVESIFLQAFSNLPVNISQGLTLSINDIVKIVQELIGYEGAIEHDLTYPDGAQRKILSNKKFLSMFPRFVFTPFEKAISETVEYYMGAVEEKMR